MDKQERLELRRKRLERLGRWDLIKKTAVQTVSPMPSQPNPVKTVSTDSTKRKCGCSRSKG